MSERRRFVSFRLQGGLYALPATGVEKIFSAPIPTPLPGAPALVSGLAPLEGRLLVLIDAARLLGLPFEAGPQTALSLAAPHAGLALVVPSPTEVELGEPLAGGDADLLLGSGPARLIETDTLMDLLTRTLVAGLGGRGAGPEAPAAGG